MSRRSRRPSRLFKKRLRKMRRAARAMKLEASQVTMTTQQRLDIADISRHLPLSLIPLQFGVVRRRTRQSQYLQKLIMEGWDRNVDKSNWGKKKHRIRPVGEGKAS